MKMMYLCILLLISGWFIPQTASQYQKLTFLAVGKKITAITSCKLFSNTLYTTEDGVLHHWVMVLVDNEYPIGGGSSAYHQLECGRYAWKNGHPANVGVLDDKGNVKVWREILEDNLPIKSKLIPIDFKPIRQSIARDITVDNDYIAIGYHNISANTTQSAVDIYGIESLIPQPTTLLLDNPYRKIKLDINGNLAVIAEQGGSLFFKYYLVSKQVLTKKLAGFDVGAKFELDYEEGE